MAARGRTTLEVGADGVAIITIINPPVNSLSIDGAKGKFSGGFDIAAFGGLQGGKVAAPKPGFVSVEILTDIVEASKKPSVAAIDGLALGGGLEVAMGHSGSHALLCDLVGFGVAIATGGQYVMNFPERTYKSMLIPLMQDDKRGGEATRRGFYIYDDRRKASPDPEIKKYIEKAREMSGVSIDPKVFRQSFPLDS
nr:glyoxysomal fatty acid beta-oxidation multifunctional protein MFP-A [Ipomoea batatas]